MNGDVKTCPFHERIEKQVDKNADNIVKLKLSQAKFWVLGSIQTIGVLYLVINKIVGG